MPTPGGPADTETLMVCPCFTGVPAAGDWATMVPCCWLLCTVAGCRVSWFALAHCCIALMSWPTRLGSASPSTTSTATGLFSGQEVPAGGSVPATWPMTGLLAAPTGLVAAATVSPAARSAASACATESLAGIDGTLIIRGPEEMVSTIVAPGSARPDGEVLITSSLGTLSSITDDPVRTWKPACCSACVAAAAVILDTAGTCVYRPEVSHQPPPHSPTTTSRAAIRYTSRLLNSHRCRNGSSWSCRARLAPR